MKICVSYHSRYNTLSYMHFTTVFFHQEEIEESGENEEEEEEEEDNWEPDERAITDPEGFRINTWDNTLLGRCTTHTAG